MCAVNLLFPIYIFAEKNILPYLTLYRVPHVKKKKIPEIYHILKLY